MMQLSSKQSISRPIVIRIYFFFTKEPPPVVYKHNLNHPMYNILKGSPQALEILKTPNSFLDTGKYPSIIVSSPVWFL